ncbi:mechanosensitive ion channel-like protein [Neolewinella xylanilytica]|uniref:Mechanosensitive ion channel-like protein n=1 Tax=Neolewinella xylanilytica TaxID=1514080 RepID=A0A2S6I7A9_9BACT|nr:mechanosensitive ion channel domain-containing protein [Neolewinella xylanilytica]PPK87339.1 mechanosensitive ion channel-like protein [Neolewinella xylanilytica]
MDQLREIILLDYLGFRVTAYQLLLIGVATVLLLGTNSLLVRRLLPWYYGREAVSPKNRSRVRNVTRFTLFSLLVIAILRILNIDITFVNEAIQQASTSDGPPVYLVIRISTIVKALLAFIVANVLDILIEELLVQRYHRMHMSTTATAQSLSDEEQAASRFRAVRPFMYTMAALVVLNDTGLAALVLYAFRDATGETTSTITVGNVVFALGVFLFLRLLLMAVTNLILGAYYRRSKVDSGSQYAINRLITYFVYVVGVLLVIQAAGFDLVVLWTGAAALLVGIGIGLQQTFNDLICGVIILFERGVMVGDVVEVSNHQIGTVRKIGARTATIETRDDIIIFVPNSKLIGENVVNWSQVERKARFHVGVGVAYGSDTALVKEILLKVALDHPRIMNTPNPIVRFLDFGSSSLDFEIIFWSRDFLRIEDVKSDVRFAIDQGFREKGVEIPFPQRDLWIRGGSGLDRVIRTQEAAHGLAKENGQSTGDGESVAETTKGEAEDKK